MKKITFSCLPLIVGVIVLGLPACSKKALQSGGDTQSSLQEGMAKGGMTNEGTGSTFPDTSLSGRGDGNRADSGRGDSNGLRGLDRHPSEERLGAGAGSTLVAKSDPGALNRQLAEIRAEQVASVTAGLRDVFFAYDSFSITDEGRHALSSDAEWAKSNPFAQLKIEGHCDERGTSAYNLVLGEKRAKAVRNFLVELGVNPTYLSVVSYGKERPFCTEHSESCYSQNRRGHLVVKSGK